MSTKKKGRGISGVNRLGVKPRGVFFNKKNKVRFGKGIPRYCRNQNKPFLWQKLMVVSVNSKTMDYFHDLSKESRLPRPVVYNYITIACLTIIKGRWMLC